MPDDIDLSQERDIHHADTAVRLIQAHVAEFKPEPLPALCLNGCGEPPAAGLRYCCQECFDMHRAREATLKKQGRR